MPHFHISFVLLLWLAETTLSLEPLQMKFAWKKMDYAYPNEEARRAALASGAYIPQNNLPVGMTVWNNHMFVSVPRWRKGIPSTLNCIDLNSKELSPKLEPYPNWEYNKEGNCDGLTTTYRMRVDKCDRLWVLDDGTSGYEDTAQKLCPYAVHVFDLRTNQRIHKYTFKPEDTNEKTFIANIAVEVGYTCKDTYMYASDELGYGLIVYSLKDNDSWRFEHSYFYPDPLRGDYNIAGLNFQWGTEGIFGMVITRNQKGDRALLFSPLSSFRTFYVNTEILKNKSRVDNSYHEFHYFPERGPNSHATAHFMDDNGILWFNFIDQNAVACWDSRKPFIKEHIEVVAQNRYLIFPCDLCVDKNQVMWVMNDQMPVHLLSQLDMEKTNFRVFYNSVPNLISGTVCDPSKRY